MKKNLILIAIICATVILGTLSVVTALRIKELGTEPIAPSVPKSKPAATENFPASSSTCQLEFTVKVAPSGTPTPTPTAGPSPTPNPEPYCDYLHVDKNSGTVPLTVHFEGKGYDINRVKGFRFVFGDGDKKEVTGSFTKEHVETADHTYNQTGSFNAYLEILDDGDHWRTRNECRQTITLTGESTPTSTPRPTSTPKPTSIPKPTATPTEVMLPTAGIKIPTLGGILGGFLMISIGAALLF